MATLNLRVTALFGCLLSGLTAQAGPVTFDFTGTGFVCTYASNGDCASHYDGAFTGNVTIEVLADGASGADSYTDGSSFASDYNGWAQADFLIQWGSDSFNPGPVPSQISSDNLVQIGNDFMRADFVSIRENYAGSDGLTYFHSNAQLARQTNNLSWLSDLSFPDGLGFASGPGVGSQITFNNFTRTTTGESSEVSGYSGIVDVSSFTVHPTAVPEPGTLALFGFGLAGFGLFRRRRVMHPAAQ